MLTRNKLLICNTSLYGLSAQSSYQRSISQQAWPPYHIPSRVQPSWAAAFGNPHGDKLFALCFHATSAQSVASFFSLLQRSHIIFCHIPEVILLWVAIQNKLQQTAACRSSGHRHHGQQTSSFSVACHWANYENNFSFGFCPKTVL